MGFQASGNVDGAIAAYAANAGMTRDELKTQFQISDFMARKIQQGNHPKQVRAGRSAPDAEPAFAPFAGSASTPPLVERKQGSSLSEPSDEAVESAYALACMLAAVGMAALPPNYQMTERDRELILKPVTRMYLRRKSMPTLTPDQRDQLTLLIGVFGYGMHSLGGRYIGRDNRQPGRRAANGPAGPARPAPAPAPGPGAGHQASAPARAPNAPAGGFSATGDPQSIMDQLGRALAEDAKRRADAGDPDFTPPGGPDA